MLLLVSLVMGLLVASTTCQVNFLVIVHRFIVGANIGFKENPNKCQACFSKQAQV